MGSGPALMAEAVDVLKQVLGEARQAILVVLKLLSLLVALEPTFRTLRKKIG